ncbi:MAG: sigma-70 family RNA polymerase sigma factor [Acidimicrobiales bacterium]
MRRSADVHIPDLDELDDATLVAAIARRDHVALAEAHRRHAAAVHALARRLVGTGAFAEEVVQEVFLRLWDRPGRFDPSRGSLRAYLLTQSHGRALDLLRAEIARHEREARDVRRAPRATDDLEHHVVDLTTAEQVREVMSDLPDRERAAIELAYLGGCSYREVAALLGLPEGTVKSRIRTGLQKMRRSLVSAGWEFTPAA